MKSFGYSLPISWLFFWLLFCVFLLLFSEMVSRSLMGRSHGVVTKDKHAQGSPASSPTSTRLHSFLLSLLFYNNKCMTIEMSMTKVTDMVS